MKIVAVARASDIPPGTIRGVDAEGKSVLIANVDGRFYAMQRKCPHLGGDLTKGTLRGATVVCPSHSAVFDLASGTALGPAKVLIFKMTPKPATTYPVKVEDGQLFVSVPW